MGEVSDPVKVGRTSPAVSVAAAPSLSDLAQLNAADRWTGPPDTAPGQVVSPDAPIPPSIQPQSQALVLLQTQALSLDSAGVAPMQQSTGSLPQTGSLTKTDGGVATKAIAARRFQRVRQLYAGADEPSPLISLVG
jgi:hypothetical protein